MEGRVKLGALFDKHAESPSPKVSGGTMLDRLASMASRIERRLNDAFNSGQAARRFNGVGAMMLPVHHFEEVGEATQARQTVAGGRFDYVPTVQLSGLEEISEFEAF